MSNQIKLTVGGVKYTVKSDDSAEYLNELGMELEERLSNITRRCPTISTTMVAVMAALEATDELKKAEKEISRLKAELKSRPAIQQKIRFNDK